MTSTELDEVAEHLVRFRDDPLGYVEWNFPWGEEGTPLQDKEIRVWQRQFLTDLGAVVRERGFDGIASVLPVLFAVSSGHGIGKSALTSWIIKWILDTRYKSKGTVTANTGDQLKTKTWAELGKWHKMSITEEFFTYHNTRGNMSLVSIEEPEEWFCTAQTCREENSESFAGQHSDGSTSFYIFDEASAVPSKIWEVAQGGLVRGEPFFFAFGNPTRNVGEFHEAFGAKRHRWNHRQIDSRTVEGTNQELIQQWVDDYGEDSDWVRVRVRGVFPSSAVCQLIPSDKIEEARGKQLLPSQYNYAPKVLGVDVARFGGDKSTIYMRQGFASWKLHEFRGILPDDLASIVMQCEDEHNTDATFIDMGMGFATVDTMRRLGRSPIGIYFGGGSSDPHCLNKRAQMWNELKEWICSGGAIPDEPDLIKDLNGVEYHFQNKGDKIQLTKKEDMKKIGLASPDDGDGLALTFAEPVVKKAKRYGPGGSANHCSTDYDPLEGF